MAVNSLNVVTVVNHIRNKRCAIEVFICFTYKIQRLFYQLSHSKGTRGKHLKLISLKIRTEIGRKTFEFQGSLIYNHAASK